MPALDGYVSPYLRKAVFDRLNPGNTVEYDIVPIEEAFPAGYTQYEGKATHAIVCTIIKADGSFITGAKEMDLFDRNRPIPPTPENLVKDQTKALGRALRDAGIPQKVDEMRSLMSWIADLDGRVPMSHSGRVDRSTGEIIGSSDPDDVDSPDAGSEPTIEQVLFKRFSELSGADKALVVKYAREQFEITNVARAGDKAEDLLTYIATMHTQQDEEPDF